jgi:hypothetical protein
MEKKTKNLKDQQKQWGKHTSELERRKGKIANLKTEK